MKNQNYHLMMWRFKQAPFMIFIFAVNLKASKFIFQWYYSRVPEHFHQWPFFKSVSLLIQNYVHLNDNYKSNERHLGDLIKENTKLCDKISNIEIKALIDESSVDFINNSFGLNIPKASDN